MLWWRLIQKSGTILPNICRWEQVGCWEFPKMQSHIRKHDHAAYEKIDADIEELVHDWMSKSPLLAHPYHVPEKWDLGLWKLLDEYTKHNDRTLVRLYRCPSCGKHNHGRLWNPGWMRPNGYMWGTTTRGVTPRMELLTL